MQVNIESIRETIRRLRSGQYHQIKTQLGDENNGRCCLGVMSDVAETAGIVTHVLDGMGRRIYISPIESDSDPGQGSYLHPRVAQWYGFVQNDGEYIDNPELGDEYLDGLSLACANDSGYSFNDIADALEKRYLSASTEGGEEAAQTGRESQAEGEERTVMEEGTGA